MTSSNDDNVIDIGMRRAQQRKEEGDTPVDPAYRAADVITRVYAELATRVSAKDLYAAMAIAEKTMDVMLTHAVGEEHTSNIKEQGRQKSQQFRIDPMKHYEGPTVFDKEKEDE